MSKPTRSLLEIAKEVKSLHDRDEALSKARAKTKVEQRDVRLRIGQLVTQVPVEQLGVVAEKSGYAVARLKDFALVREAWPEGTFPDDASYTPLEELARDPERFAKITAGMSKRDARAARGGKVDTPSRWSSQVKSDFIKEALADPEVARQVAEDVQTRASIARAENDLFREHRNRRDLDPASKNLRQTVSGDDIIRRIIAARYEINRALDQAMDEGLTTAKRAEARQALAELTTTVSWFSSFLESGDTSFEEQLEQLLSQEN